MCRVHGLPGVSGRLPGNRTMTGPAAHHASFHRALDQLSVTQRRGERPGIEILRKSPITQVSFKLQQLERTESEQNATKTGLWIEKIYYSMSFALYYGSDF